MTQQTAHLQRMARSGSLSILGAGFHAIAGVVLVALITNGLTKAAAGTVFATTALFLIITAIVQLGAEVGLVRWMPAQIATQRFADVRPTLRVALLPVLVLGIVAALVLATVAPAVAGYVAGEEHAATVTDQLQILAAFLPVAAVYNVVLAGTRGFRTMKPTVMVESLARAALQLALVAAGLALGTSAAELVFAWSLPYGVGFVAGILWLLALLRRLPHDNLQEPQDASEETGSLAAQFWRYTAPRAVTNILQTLLKRSDIVLVAALRSPAEAALYTAATRFVVFGQLGVQALQQALSPLLSAHFARDERRSAADLYKTATAWAMTFAWPVYLVCAVLAPALLGIFGGGYADATEVVVILSLAMLVATASGAVDTVLLMSGHSWLSLANTGTALAINIGMNIVLIPEYGILGAAISWAVAIVVRNALPLIEIQSFFGMSPAGPGSIWVGLSALACFGVVPGALQLLDASTTAVVLALVVGALAYLGLLWLGRERLQLSAFRGIFLRRRAVPAESA